MIPFDTDLMPSNSYLHCVSWLLSSTKLPHWNLASNSFEISNFGELHFIYFICALIEYHRDNNPELDLFLEFIEDMSDHEVLLHNYTCKVDENDITSIVRPIFEYFQISDYLVDSFVQNASDCFSIVDLFSELYIFLTKQQLYHQSKIHCDPELGDSDGNKDQRVPCHHHLRYHLRQHSLQLELVSHERCLLLLRFLPSFHAFPQYLPPSIVGGHHITCNQKLLPEFKITIDKNEKL
ncbi:hypothetical protein GEMRC1_002720 [Eukaryota sp. GEM-RC1]